MSFFFKACVLMVLFSSIGLAKDGGETALPVPTTEEPQAVTLEDATKKLMQDTKNKILAAKTEVVAGKKIHVIKILTATGHIQYIKIDAATGIPLDKPSK